MTDEKHTPENPKAQVSEQPSAQPPMTVAPGGNRNAKNLPNGPDGTREWSYGLFDCCDEPGKALLATFCPCVVYSRNKRRYTHLTDHGTPDPAHGGPIPNASCMAYAGFQIFHWGWLLQLNVTPMIRQRYNIRGSKLTDVLTALCCVPCGLVRQSREIELEEQSVEVKHA